MRSNEAGAGRHSHIVIILLSVIVGAMLAGVAIYYPRAHAPVAAQQAAASAAASWEDAFVSVADKTLPCVVSIAVETRGPAGGPTDLGDQLKDDPLFGPFFRDLEKKRGERQEQRPRGQGLGSGWIYSEDGYIVTNSHVVRDAEKITVRLHDRERDDKEYPATLVGTDPKTELAVIKIEAPRKLPTLALGDSKGLKVGRWVMAVGAPFRLEQTATVGIISAKGRFLPGQSDDILIGDVIQTDASINPGNSGGPLVDLAGNVIGINVAIYSNPLTPGNVGIGFAIPAETAKAVVPQLIESKRVARGWLGIVIEEADEHLRDFLGVPDGGIIVQDITDGGPAASSELKVEDVIVAVDGEQVRDSWSLQKAIGNTKPGATVTLDVVRDKKPIQVKVKLGEMPARYTGLEESGGVAEAVAQEQSALGVTVETLTPEMIEQLKPGRNVAGVVVTAVDPTGPAVQKLFQGDIILQLNGVAIKGLDDYQAQLKAAKDNGRQYVVVRLLHRGRDGKWTAKTTSIEPKW